LSRYRIEFRPAAIRALGRLDPPVAERIRKALVLLAADPRPPAARPLKGRDAWRLRVGPWRVIYSIEDDRLVVLVVTLGHRRDVYD
jgi:mRNA interferase RelE/StbE